MRLEAASPLRNVVLLLQYGKRHGTPE